MLIRIALAIDILLTAISHVCPQKTKDILPLGGDSFGQIAVLLLLAVAIGDFVKKRKSDE